MTDPISEHRVVAGVDGSPPSRLALQWAQFMARALGAAVDAVTVWDISAVEASAWADDWDPEQDAAKSLHATLAEVLGPQPLVAVHEIVRHGSAAAELLQASHGAQLLVLGRRGHGGFAGLQLGSVSAACAAHAHCPVLIIHGDTPPPPTVQVRPAPVPMQQVCEPADRYVISRDELVSRMGGSP